MDAADEIVREFLAESGENLDRLDQEFVLLEQEMASAPPERLASIFRTIHTIKGTCGFLGFDQLGGVTHVGENLLSRLRDGKLAVTTEIISTLLKLVDAVRAMLASIESTGNEGARDDAALKAELTRLSEGTPAVPEVPIVEAKPEPEAKLSEPVSHGLASSAGIRVDVGLLDKLMNLVGELVLARNQILQHSSATENLALAGPAQRLNLITTELQEGVMKTRMQPIDNLWSKLPRIVRDLSQSCGKQVRVEMEGRSTELDKTILEAIKDPLTHIIRNSVDHGIETPEKRTAAGKNAEGRLFLRAFHEGGQVNLEIIDDGGGIPPARVKAKAVERGLITAEQAAKMSDREAINLIFAPGFSTAEQVTSVSGRGVGMDVVKTNIEKIGGSVDVQSKLGEGTTLRIKIPLTLAIIPALTITSSGERFAIPQVNLLELVRLEDDAARGIERIGGTPVYRLRGNLLPLVYLDEQLHPNARTEPRTGATNIVVLQAEERQFGLVVDEINDTEEIVVKPLGGSFKGLTTFAGATIMGDGRVALILDVVGVAQRANLIGGGRERPAYLVDEESVGSTQEERQTLLIFQPAERRRMAMPLSQVSRLEEFSPASIETIGEQRVVQYRNRILPLVSLADWLGHPPPESDRPLQAIVYTRGHASVGLIVDRIVDIVEEAVAPQSAGSRQGVLGSAVIGGRVTELLDARGVIDGLLPGWEARAA